jgi:eukaryotic-like serine/threonine-protein kinase
MLETRPLHLIPEARLSNGAPGDRNSTSAGDDWLCLSWLDRFDHPLPQVLPTDGKHLTIDGYELLREVGRGEIGIVYLARDRKFKRRVAIKLFREELADPATATRVHGEIEAAGRLRHANIVQIHEIGQRSGCLYVVMDYVDGPNLKQLLDGTPLAPRRAAELLEPAARALQYACERGVCHGGLKPNHILYAAETEAADPEQAASLPVPLSEFRVPRIIDFWVANCLDGEAGLKASGEVEVLPTYLAPEQTESTPRVGPETDVFALGSILYEMLVGMPPFIAPEADETIRYIRNREPVPPRRLQPRVPRDLESICMKCLRKEPRKRYPNAGELADNLRRFLEGRAVKAKPFGSLTQLVRSVLSGS